MRNASALSPRAASQQRQAEALIQAPNSHGFWWQSDRLIKVVKSGFQ